MPWIEAGGRRFEWAEAPSAAPQDWGACETILRAAGETRRIVFQGFSLGGLDSVFRLRALQLLNRDAPHDAAAVVYLSAGSGADNLAPGLGRRIRTSWPFRSVLFVAEGEGAAALEAEGLPVLAPARARRFSPSELFDHPEALRSQAAADQAIGVQIQPVWGRCGSSTAFANEIDCLVDQGLFTIRVFIEHQLGLSETLRRDLDRSLPENRLDAGPCFEALACQRTVSRQNPADETEAFAEAVLRRTSCTVEDQVVARLLDRATVAIVNHAITIGFAARVCPQAKLVLDTHDYLTRAAFDRARVADNAQAFPDRRTLRRHVELEHRLWSAADVCTLVSLSEEVRIRRHAAASLMVFPAPYVKPWRDPGEGAAWDLLLVADRHFFNVQSVSWFLTEVVSPRPELRRLRIGVVGNIGRVMEADWADRLPNVKWLGFVKDLDETRNQSRLALCPDRAGTGISVKALSALSAGQPVVATSIALRGMPSSVLETSKATDTAEAMADDILALLQSREAVAARSESSLRVREILRQSGSYTAALELAKTRSKTVAQARRALLSEVSGGPGAGADGASNSEPMPTALPPGNRLKLDLNKGGDAAPFLDFGWHEGEAWGRWTDGQRALVRLPAAWFAAPGSVVIQFVAGKRPVGVAVFCRGRRLTPKGLTTRRRTAAFGVDRAMEDPGEGVISLEIIADSSVCPREVEGSSDDRVLGVGVTSLAVMSRPRRTWIGALSGYFGR